MTIEQEISKKTRGIVTETSFFQIMTKNITLSLQKLKKDLTFQKNRQTGCRIALQAASQLDLKGIGKVIPGGFQTVKERAIRAKSGFVVKARC
ncbi:hypothetical protein ACE2AK_13360 [Rahnella perminowiae]|uniref:hypothetical protein n=1 Tax=Rahnella perminowiae TaxID=2816244 RepID=UPI001C2688C8|nr:hypothetical protein [Rahnella perminowiae]MBU9825686.1 hypothetical protein [Rahnella perminowiae]MCR8999146.1 hypothetical protein [Rahnella perminowiae]